MPGPTCILYVDSDSESRLVMQELLAPHMLDLAATEEEARELVRRRSYDLYILAGSRSGSSDIALCEWLQRMDGRTPIVFCSSNGTARHQQAAIAAGAVRYLVKPIDPTLLRSTLGLLLKLAELESARAMATEEQAIRDELLHRTKQLQLAAHTVRQKALEAIECMVRVKAYRGFRQAGGNRANFERMWPGTLEKARRRV